MEKWSRGGISRIQRVSKLQRERGEADEEMDVVAYA